MNIRGNTNTFLQGLVLVTVLVDLCFGIRPASAAIVNEIEPNNSVDNAQNIDGNFTVNFDPNIGDKESNTSTSIPHATIIGTGDNTFDHYSFTVTEPASKGIFDIDFGSTGGSVDTFLQLYDSSGTLLALDDDSINSSHGQGGSESNLDSYLEFTFKTTGVYIIQVGSCCTNGVDPRSDYQLQVSLEHPLVTFDPLTIHKSRIWFANNPSKDKYQIKGTFTLASLNNGIDPLTEEIRVKVGRSLLIIPPGSFVADMPKYKYKGTLADTDVRMVIEERGGDTYKFNVKVKGVDLTNTTNPPDIRLQIGNDGGVSPIIRLKGKLTFNMDHDHDDDRGRNHSDDDD